MQPFTLFSEPDAYARALDEFRALPDVANIGLGPHYNCHSLDQMFPLAWSTHVDEDRYKYQHVEYLLDQAADLLDRGIRDRAQWEDLYEKWLRNALEVYELLAIDDVQQREETAGIFEVPYKLSSGEVAANAGEREWLQAACTKVSALVSDNLGADGQAALVNFRSLLARFGTFDKTSTHDLPIPTSYQGEPAPLSLQEKMCFAEAQVARREAAIQGISFAVQAALTQSSLAAAQARAVSLLAKETFDRINQTFQSERRAIARKVVAAKQLASILDGGALNFESRMKPIQERYENDFSEALARIQAAARGLKLLYGYHEPLPLPASDSGLHFFDDCLIWVRKAISFLVRFQRLDQSYVLPFSLKRLCGANWANGLAAGVLQFELRETDFPHLLSQRHLRLRGFSVFALGEAAKGTWQVVVTAPKSSYCKHADGARLDLDQVRAAPCLAGRASGRDATSQPDVLGTIEFFNLSPYGHWEVQVPPTSLEDIASAQIGDIHLDLHITARVLP